jgi:cation diffusion facilitator CzcD-associated flavoprotein CzcO
MSKQIKRVAVIGAGPSGAIAVHALAQEQSFAVLQVFDRRNQIGGTWWVHKQGTPYNESITNLLHRIYTPELAPKIHSLNDVLQQNADKPVGIPTEFPAKTKKTPKVNSHQIRFSDTPMHDHLETNIPASVMGYTQEPFPGTLSERSIILWGKKSPFRHRDVIRGWVEGIYKRHGYENYVELRTTVELAEKVGNEWILTLRKETPGGEDDIWWQENFDAIVVANGHYNVPNIPQIAGLVEFERKHPGSVIHSKHYRRPEDYLDKVR